MCVCRKKEDGAITMKNKIKQIQTTYEKFVRNAFGRPASELTVLIYGHEMQICGGILKYVPEIHAIISPHIQKVGDIIDDRQVFLPEAFAPFNENTVVIVSMMYEYMYEEIAQKLQSMGLSEANAAHGKSLAIAILDIAGETFAQGGMDLLIKDLFVRSGKNLSKIKYLELGVNNYSLYNNTYLFYKLGASGVLVEANPELHENIQKNRPRDILLRCGCASDGSQEQMMFYSFGT